MPDTVIRADKLKKKYGQIVALDGISLEVERGTIFGLLGPNGAGKTTAVKILTTLVRPDEGRVEVAGTDVVGDPVRARRLIGYVPQELTVDPYLTVR
ncbi:MAG: ATP-binding cassette domain-containing protein, partial [Deltaproteobacteria bacterium]|nr:ATP-binding cassette domain-containing protein [Deltaproteobacteria bacterium]